jgi:hypothetical protein
MKPDFPRQIFKKYSNIKFNENPSNGSGLVPRAPTDITKLIIAYRNFANAHRKGSFKLQHQQKANIAK